MTAVNLKAPGHHRAWEFIHRSLFLDPDPLLSMNGSTEAMMSYTGPHLPGLKHVPEDT